jgi:ankyrin repeat protein
MSDRFQRAARAVVDGESQVLTDLLDAAPELVHARSRDRHAATLLHFVAANGVPDEMQRSPANAVEITRALLNAGAEPDALARGYGGGENETTLCLLVSSWPPFERGVQGALVRALVEGGAAVDGRMGDGAPLSTALLFGYTAAAEALAEAGARVESLFHRAGLGRLDAVRECLAGEGILVPEALGAYVPPIAKDFDPDNVGAAIQEAFHFAVTHGRIEVAELLLLHGADVNASTTGHHCELPLLQAAFVHEPAIGLWLLERGADPGLVDRKRGESPRAFIERSGPPALAAHLRSPGA